MFAIKLHRMYRHLDELYAGHFGFALADTSLSRFSEYFYRDRDPSGLGITRLFFGLLMLLDVPEERGGATMDMRWGHADNCHFPLFPFLRPLRMPYMAIVYSLLWTSALGVAVGYRYRTASLVFAACYWYLFLIEKSFWNNHSYLFGVVAALLASTQAHRFASLDGYADLSIQKAVPQWNYSILKYQFCVLYVLAGVKKGAPEWLAGYSMRGLSSHWVFEPFKLFLTSEQTDLYVVHWFIFLFDLTIACWMSWRRTRTVAVLFCVAFHFMNIRLFDIGMFPWVCLATIPLFYPVDWPKRLLRMFKNSYFVNGLSTMCKCAKRKTNKTVNNDKHKGVHNGVRENKKTSDAAKTSTECVKKDVSNEERTRRIRVTRLLFIFMALQAFLPFSHFITKGYNNWSNGLYGYSWDMMVNSYSIIHTVVKVVNNDNNREMFIKPGIWAPNDRWSRHADQVYQYAHCIRRNLSPNDECDQCNKFIPNDKALWLDEARINESFSTNISVYVDVWCSMNGRFHQRFYDPNVDLIKAKWSPFSKPDWVMPLLTNYDHWRRDITLIERDLSRTGKGVTFFADFPVSVQVMSIRNRRACMRNVTKIEKAAEVCKEGSWKVEIRYLCLPPLWDLGVSLWYTFENYINQDLKNITLIVLEGSVTYEPPLSYNGGVSYEMSSLLTPGESVDVLSERLHKVRVHGSTPALYMYTFTEAVKSSGSFHREKLPVVKELTNRIKNVCKFLHLIGLSYLNLFFNVPMEMRRGRNYDSSDH